MLSASFLYPRVAILNENSRCNLRAITLGNRRLLVNLDENLFVRDIFYRRVGQENHVLGVPHRIGVFIRGNIYWLDDPSWIKKTQTDCSLCGVSSATNEKLGVTLTFIDIVLKDTDVFIRKITSNAPVRLFIYHYFFLYGDGIGDCAGYDPERNSIFHYKRSRYFLITALQENKQVLADFTIGNKPTEIASWVDAEDGVLDKNPIAQGNVDSCVALDLAPNETTYYVMCAARSFAGIHRLADELALIDIEREIEKTIEEQHWFARPPDIISDLKAEWRALYETSMLILRCHTDEGGAITAANDSDNMLFNRDTYSYVWGRDGALVAVALARAGKHELCREFFSFMKNIIEPEGYYLHKYHPDGSIGSSWHAWVRDGKPYLPIQEDSTALILWSLKVYHDTAGDDFTNDKWEWIKSMLDFLMSFRRDDILLPKDCWDLWEERQGIHTWTVASVIAGLRAGAFFARRFDDEARAVAAEEFALNLTQSMISFLGSTQYGRFARRLLPELQPDLTIDAADFAPLLFGVLAADNAFVTGTAKAVAENLSTPSGGIARYQGDYFFRQTEEAPGNPWIICTLWLAQWHIAVGDLSSAEKLIDWTVKHQTVAGLLPEQVHPLTGVPLSVCPLTWSHATFVDTLLLYGAALRSNQTKVIVKKAK